VAFGKRARRRCSSSVQKSVNAEALSRLSASSFDAAERIHNPFPGGIEKALDPLSPILVRSLQSKKEVIYYSIIIRLRTYAVKLSEVKKTALPNELLKSSSLENDSICLRKSLRT
jgi:hypothetical protein